MKKTTTITISEETWNELNKRKILGESMDELIRRLYLEVPEREEAHQLENLKINFPEAYKWHMENMEKEK